MILNHQQSERYRKQMRVPGMTREAQTRLLAGKVLLLGANQQASVILRNLIEVGLGTVVLVDESKGALKETTEALSLEGKTKDTSISTRVEEISSDTLESLIGQFDVVVDCAEDWQQKLLFSDVCMSMKKPLLHAGATGFRFQIYTMLPGKSACLRCVLPEVGIDEVPLEPHPFEVFALVSELVGTWQSMEIVKIVGDLGATQGNELFKFDCLSGEFDVIRGLDPRRDCPDCG